MEDLFKISLFKKGSKEHNFEDLLSEIYANQQANKRGLEKVTSYLTARLSTPDIPVSEIQQLSFNLVDYFKITVINDDQLIKMAAVISKFLINKQKYTGNAAEEFVLSPEEREQIMKEIGEL